jgi:hypothetical protein
MQKAPSFDEAFSAESEGFEPSPILLLKTVNIHSRIHTATILPLILNGAEPYENPQHKS